MSSARLLYKHSDGFVQLRTDPFRPAEDADQLIEQLNACYDGQGEPLISLERFVDGTVSLTGATVLLCCACDFDLSTAESPDDAKRLLNEVSVELEQDGVPGWIRNVVVANLETGIPLGAFLPFLVGAGQAIKVQLTDSVNGNSEYVLTT